MVVYLPMIIMTVCMASMQVKVKRKWEKRIILLMTVLPATLVAAFRYNNGADYLMYLRLFKDIGSGHSIVKVDGKSLEKGFILLVKLCQTISREPCFSFGIIALLIICLIFKGCIDSSEDYKLSVLLFFVSGIYFDSFNGLRQYIAMAVFFYGMKYIFSKEIKKYILCCLIGYLFHKSVLFLIPLYFIQFIKIDLKRAVLIILIGTLSMTMIYKVVLFFLAYTPYAYFLTSAEMKNAVTSQSAIFFFVVNTVIGYFFYNQNEIIEEKTQILFNIQVLFLIIALLTTTVPLVSRILSYGLLFEVLYIPSMLEIIKKRSIKSISVFLIVILYIMINLYGIYCNGWYGCIPYNFY